MKKKAGSLPFGVGQDFFCSSNVQRLVLIIVENSVDIEKAKVDKVRRVGREKKHVIQVENHSFTAVFQAETKAHFLTAWWELICSRAFTLGTLIVVLSHQASIITYVQVRRTVNQPRSVLRFFDR